MQVFANGKRRFYSFMEFCAIHLKIQREKFDHGNIVPWASSVVWIGLF